MPAGGGHVHHLHALDDAYLVVDGGFRRKVATGTRTRDRLDHNQELYLLSYAHREAFGM
jgi:hypothetical protein